jgi:predicted ABC-type transport system involved in lysophospholipase L1 biosynthesis ATPase subunit
MTLLSLRGVCKRCPDGAREVVVLRDVSLDVDDGDFVGVWGARRSGKSTLLRIVAGMEPPDSGEVLFGGVDVAKLSVGKRLKALRAGVGFAASWRPHRHERAIDHVAWSAMSEGNIRLRHARGQARRALERVDMLACAHARTSDLSLGELVRIELARALVRGPRLLLVDEPPVLSSPREGHDLYALLRSLGKERDLAVVLASEDADLIGKARRPMAIGRGRLRTTDKEGTVFAFRNRGQGKERRGA